MNKGNRLLAAIMFTDMVGYTALMQEDEVKAKTNRDRHRKILQESIASHNGEILQYYGDGTLSIFNSAIEAVDCAVQIQTELQKEPKIPLRIGMHTGDIVYDDEGIYGDGVNVASRIEGLAVSGSVLISEKVFDEVKNHHVFSASSLGTFDLKNVKKPMEVYAISNEDLIVPTKKEIKTQRKEEVKSIAVLPFVNISNDPDNEYFSDGITEELLNVLAKVEGLQVTARTSSFAFKGRNEDIKQIGIQLGAKTILEGSVRKAGNRVRITAQLVNASDGYHIWSETYDRMLDDIFEVQDEISLKITNTLREKLTLKPEKETFIKPPTQNIEAYNIYLKGLFHANKWTLEDAEIAIEEFNKALNLEPEFALLYSKLSVVHIYLGASGKKPAHEVFPKAKEYALKAIELDDTASESHDALGHVYFFYEWNWNEAYKSLEKAIGLNSNNSTAYLGKAMWLAIHGKFDEAIENMIKSIQLDPFYAPGNYGYAAILTFAGRFDKASEQLDKLFEISPYFPDALCLKGLVYQILGEFDKAKDLFTQVMEIPGFQTKAYSCLGGLYVRMKKPEMAKKYLDKLLTIEKTIPNQPIFFDIAFLYRELDDPDKMFSYLNKSAEAKESNVLYILGQPQFNKYHSDPRFQGLLMKIGLKNVDKL